MFTRGLRAGPVSLSQLDSACGDYETNLSEGLTIKTCYSSDENNGNKE